MPENRIATVDTAYDIQADMPTPRIKLRSMIYDSTCVYTIVVKMNGVDVVSLNVSAMSTGSHDIDLPLTVQQRTSLLNALGITATFKTAALVLYTYSDDRTTLIGFSGVDVGVKTSMQYSAPTFTDFTFEDTDSAAQAIVHNNQIAIQHQSSINVNFSGIAPKDNARIANYTVAIGSVVVSQNVDIHATTPVTLNSLVFGVITEYSETMYIAVSVTDSRGYTVKKRKTITVVPYQIMTFNSWDLERFNQSTAIQAVISGAFPQLKYNNTVYYPPSQTATPSNTVINCRYREKYGSTWTSLNAIPVTLNSNNEFTFSTQNLIPAGLDDTKAYTIEFYATGAFNEYISFSVDISKGTPLIAFRENKIGVHTNSPTVELDIVGQVNMNGYGIMGYSGQISSTDDLDDIRTSGIFQCNSGDTTYNYPVNYGGILEVYRTPAFIVQRYIGVNNLCYYRMARYVNSAWAWESWRRFTAEIIST